MSRYLIVGAGRSGINAAQLLIKVGEDFIIYDGNENFDTAAACEKIGRDNIEFILGDFSGFDFSRVDICVVSPGAEIWLMALPCRLKFPSGIAICTLPSALKEITGRS